MCFVWCWCSGIGNVMRGRGGEASFLSVYVRVWMGGFDAFME